jgi:glycosyltransferase involved in cell wall biosynthesis
MRVAIVAGICVNHDAISNSVADQATMLQALPMVDHVAVLTGFSDRPLNADEVVHLSDGWELVRHPTFAKADVVIFHWGIAYPLFDALAILPNDPRIIVHFHNMTPVELSPPDDSPNLERSLRQAQLLLAGTMRVWAVSKYNSDTLVSWGVDPARLVVLPLRVERPRSLRAAPPNTSDEIRLLTVGRLVPPKGADVLIDAMRLLAEPIRHRVHLRLASNSVLSDAGYRLHLEHQISESNLDGTVEFVDDASEPALWELYEWADVVVSPSLHEGLCVPIIEGYLAGCRAVGTDAGNLPNVVIPPDPIARAGDPESLAAALEFIVGEIAAGNRSIPSGADRLVEQFGHDAIAQQLRTELIIARDRANKVSVS